jgi:tRNA(Ile)-lysidine synthase
VRPLGAAEFAALLAPLGPFGAAPRLAVAVSGGPDSMALALLAAEWARSRGGEVLALVADHGLRPESAGEAALTLRRLAARGIAGRLLRLTGLPRGPALAERARHARHAALAEACRAAGIVHLLFGHHAADQAETLLMRRLQGSGAAGLAGMAAMRETDCLRLLRPLLTLPTGRLRATLWAAGVEWIEDPSNRDCTTLRARLRAGLVDPGGGGAAIRALATEAAARGCARAEAERVIAAVLAERASLRPEGFAVLAPGPIPPDALAALLQAISGAPYRPSLRQVVPLAAEPRPATLGGVRLMPAGRMGAGLLLVREEAALGPAVAARPGARWDGRFRFAGPAAPPPEAMLGAFGPVALGLGKRSALPAAVMRTLPALRVRGELLAVPHLDYPDAATCRALRVVFTPCVPAAGAPWTAASGAPPAIG